MSLYLGENLISGQATLVGESRNIGQIIPSAIPLTDAGLHLLDGSLIQGGGIYSAFVTYIAGLVSTYPNLFVTESAWQTAVTTYGVCGKFVYDSTNNTVRLPKYSDKIYTQEIKDATPVVGNGNAVGFNVPNSASTYALGGTQYGDKVNLAGTFYWANGAEADVRSRLLSVSTDSTKSGLVTQLSDITTSLDGYYYIVIATSTKTDIEVDIDEVVTDLNGKADVDLMNVANTAGFRKLVEVYNNGTSWYKVYREYNPQNGNYIGLWCEQGGQVYAPSPMWYSITFLKPFVDTNYLVYGSYIAATNNFSNATVGIEKTNNTTCLITVYGIGFTADWKACGYIG